MIHNSSSRYICKITENKFRNKHSCVNSHSSTICNSYYRNNLNVYQPVNGKMQYGISCNIILFNYKKSWILYMQQCGSTLEMLCYAMEKKTQKVTYFWSYLYEIFWIGKSIETVNWFVAASSSKKRGMGSYRLMGGVFFWGW